MSKAFVPVHAAAHGAMLSEPDALARILDGIGGAAPGVSSTEAASRRRFGGQRR